jgi:hypothetical protein
MLSEPGVIAELIDLKAGIALALRDLTVDRARLVRQLNRDGVPVTAGLTLPAESARSQMRTTSLSSAHNYERSDPIGMMHMNRSHISERVVRKRG